MHVTGRVVNGKGNSVKLKTITEGVKGTFIGVKLTPESNLRLAGWMRQNLIQDPEPEGELHITLVIDKDKPIPYHPVKYGTPIPIDPSTYSIDIFGKDNNVMVLKFECPFLEDRHNKLRRKYGLSWDFPSYSPHITLTNTIQEIKTELEVPNFELEFGREYMEEFS